MKEVGLDNNSITRKKKQNTELDTEMDGNSKRKVTNNTGKNSVIAGSTGVRRKSCGITKQKNKIVVFT